MNCFQRKYLSRKFVMHTAAFVVGTVFRSLDMLSGDQWVTLIGVLVSSYGISNAAHHWSERKRAEPDDWQPSGRHHD